MDRLTMPTILHMIRTGELKKPDLRKFDFKEIDMNVPGAIKKLERENCELLVEFYRVGWNFLQANIPLEFFQGVVPILQRMKKRVNNLVDIVLCEVWDKNNECEVDDEKENY